MTNNLAGNLVIVAAPSGGGKTSLVKHLIQTLDNIVVSRSHTTRPIRQGEKNGVDYYFVNEQTFTDMVNDNAFIEYANVFGHYYGTSVEQIQHYLRAGTDVVLDIDWQGAQQIRQLFANTVTIFILPPSQDILQQRLINRQRESKHIIEDRMHKAQEEMSHYSEFDYLVINDDFDKAACELKSIVIAERLQIDKQSARQAKLLSFLLSSS